MSSEMFPMSLATDTSNWLNTKFDHLITPGNWLNGKMNMIVCNGWDNNYCKIHFNLSPTEKKTKQNKIKQKTTQKVVEIHLMPLESWFFFFSVLRASGWVELAIEYDGVCYLSIWIVYVWADEDNQSILFYMLFNLCKRF